jgi:proton translocating ATP synthase F1 alpha subunit
MIILLFYMDHLIESKKVGIVKSLYDAVVIAEGLDRAFIGEVVKLKNEKSDILGTVLNIEGNITKIALIYGSEKEIRAGDEIWKTNKSVETKAGFGVLGRVVNPLGYCLNADDFDTVRYTKQESLNVKMVNVEQDAPGIIKREPVRTAVHTGLNAVDAMLPIGAGQRELVIGDLGTGKTTLVLTVILNQRFKNDTFWRDVEKVLVTDKHSLFIPCVYVVVGGRRSEMARVKRLLQVTGAFDYTVAVFTSADDLAALQHIAPSAGCAIGEWFRDHGYKAIVVYDDLSIHAQAYRQVSLLLRRPPGREAYPGDIFYVHSRLLERAAQMKRSYGGGALTALPVVETKAGDISGYIPTNVISITDGQIFLSSKLANQGIRPAVDLNLSVSRVGSDAQPSMLKEVSKRTKLDYAMFRSFQSLEKISGDLDPSIMAYIQKGKKIVSYFNQDVYKTEMLYKQIVCLFAISAGYLDRVSPAMVNYFFNLLFDLELSYTYLQSDLVVLLSGKKRLEILCQNYDFSAIDQMIIVWLRDFTSAFHDVFQKEAIQVAGLN